MKLPRLVFRDALRDGNVPWIVVGVVAVALLVSFAPGAAERVEYDRARVAGEPWRLVTGQLVHWTPRMALADLGAVLLLGALLERRRRKLLAASVALALATVGLGLHFMATEVAVYRGASGLATALFVVAAVIAVRAPTSAGARTVGLVALALLAVKIAYELAGGGALASGSLPPGVTLLPLAHLLGAAAGIAAAPFVNRYRAVRRPAA